MNRLQILTGNVTMPTIKGLKAKDAKAYEQLEKMFTAMWKAYLRKGHKGSISLPFWAQKVNNPRVMNIALKLLADAGYIITSSQPHRNWGEAKLNESKLLKFVTKSELDKVRKQFKWKHYLMNSNDVNPKCALLTKINGEVKDTGLVRTGFMKAGRTQFQLDTVMMQKHYNSVVKLVNYGIAKTIERYPELVEDGANFAEIGKEVVDTYIDCPETYNSGNRWSDSRGRDIAGYLNKIGNPIGYKIMRSLLVIPKAYRQTATVKGLEAKYLFIAELAGYKEGTIADKIEYGKKCHENRFQHTLNLDDESDLKELPDNIWLERTYQDIDNYLVSKGNYKWQVPIELDMSASVLGFYGLLLNHKPYLVRCNMHTRTRVRDAWGHKVIKNRKQFKTIMRQLYGSQMTAREMWTEMRIPFTDEEVIAFQKELLEGELSVANGFKNFLINNAKMQPEMELHVWNEKFRVECNRFFNKGERTVAYDFYDSTTKTVRRTKHTETVKVPNLQAFRRYVATALIHNLDSQAMNHTCDVIYDTFEWILPIHDAAIVDAEAADSTRRTYADFLTDIWNNRKTIIQNYVRSIGIKPAAIAEWKRLDAKCDKLKTFKCNPIVLK